MAHSDTTGGVYVVPPRRACPRTLALIETINRATYAARHDAELTDLSAWDWLESLTGPTDDTVVVWRRLQEKAGLEVFPPADVRAEVLGALNAAANVRTPRDPFAGLPGAAA
jgi:hypothetical protein